MFPPFPPPPPACCKSEQEGEKKLLQCAIYALCQSLGNNSCCHQPLIFLVFDTTHGDMFGDRILHSNPEPFERCSSWLSQHGAGFAWRRQDVLGQHCPDRDHRRGMLLGAKWSLCDQPSAEMENKILTFLTVEVIFSNDFNNDNKMIPSPISTKIFAI